VGIAGFVAILAYIVFFNFKSDSIVESIVASQNHFTALALVIFVNPTLILLILTLFHYLKNGMKLQEFTASVLLVLALEIVSLPWLPRTGMPAELSAKVSLDYVFANFWVDAGLGYGLFYFLYYLVIPLGLAWLALHLMGGVKFGNKMMGGK